MSEIEWNLPTPEDDGYLRRRRVLAELLDATPTVENTDKLLDFLLPFVEKPKDRKKAKEALLDMSKAEYGRIVLGMQGYTFKIPDPKVEK